MTTSTTPLGIMAPWMRVARLDPAQWRHWFDLFLKPNRSTSGLYLLHDQGRLISVTPNYARRTLDLPARIDNPKVLAESLYARWQQGPVVIFERAALDQFFDQIQRERALTDDLFSYLLKINARMRQTAEMVIYPDPMANWQDASPALPLAFARAVAAEGQKRSAVFGVYDDSGMLASMLLGFESGRLEFVTTLPAASGVDWRSDHRRLLSLAEQVYAPVSFGLFAPLATVERLGLNPRSLPNWLQASQRGEIVCAPGSLADFAAVLGAP